MKSKGEEIFFNNISAMIKSIQQFTKDNFAYVESCDDLKRLYYGWFCPKTNTYFYMIASVFNNQKDKNVTRYLDSLLKRKIASIYLSNLKSDKEYNTFKEKLDKMKAFW